MRAVGMITEPFEFINYLQVECIEEINEHGRLTLRGLIDPNNVQSYQNLAWKETWVNVRFIDEEETIHPFFHGILTGFRIRPEGKVYELNMEIKTGSYLWDLTPHTRSFQDPAITVEEVLARCLGDGGFIVREGNGSAIGEFLLQYEESDWQFGKRLASRLGLFLLPEYAIAGKKLYFGNKPWKRVEIADDEYTMETSPEGVVLTIESREIYYVGQVLLFQGGSYMVGRRISRLIGEEMCHKYYLLSAARREIGRKYNEKIQGLSLKANVTKVANDMVQVEIEQDENKEKSGKCWFSYATVYSTPDGTGWYCMPEIGDKVRLTFPDRAESSAYTASSVHMQAEQGRMNPSEKSWKNKYGKEVMLTPDSIKIRNNAGLSIELVDGEGIRLVSDKNITVSSGKDVKLSSKHGQISIFGNQSVSLEQSGANIRIADEIKIAGGKIYMN